jgi:hypothetical protein
MAFAIPKRSSPERERLIRAIARDIRQRATVKMLIADALTAAGEPPPPLHPLAREIIALAEKKYRNMREG